MAHHKIVEYPKATKLPEDEWILPIAVVNEKFGFYHTTKQTTIADIVESIKKKVMEGEEIEVIEGEYGIRFRIIKNKEE